MKYRYTYKNADGEFKKGLASFYDFDEIIGANYNLEDYKLNHKSNFYESSSFSRVWLSWGDSRFLRIGLRK